MTPQSKHRFIREYEFRATPKLLYPYLTTPSGLAEWFSDKAYYDGASHIFNFIWENSDHHARITAQKLNKHVKFEFLPEDNNTHDDLSYIEFKLDQNELTQSSYLKVIDYSPATNDEDLENLWEGLVSKLRELVGG